MPSMSMQGQMLELLSSDTHFVFKTVFRYQQVKSITGFSTTNVY